MWSTVSTGPVAARTRRAPGFVRAFPKSPLRWASKLVTCPFGKWNSFAHVVVSYSPAGCLPCPTSGGRNFCACSRRRARRGGAGHARARAARASQKGWGMHTKRGMFRPVKASRAPASEHLRLGGEETSLLLTRKTTSKILGRARKLFAKKPKVVALIEKNAYVFITTVSSSIHTIYTHNHSSLPSLTSHPPLKGLAIRSTSASTDASGHGLLALILSAIVSKLPCSERVFRGS